MAVVSKLTTYVHTMFYFRATLTKITPRLPPELLLHIEDLLDMASLLSFGGTCAYFRDGVSTTLTKECNDIIRRYWPEPEELLRLLTWTRGVISGEAALAFILQDCSLLCDELEISVSSTRGPELLAHFHMNPMIMRVGSSDQRTPLTTWAYTQYMYRSPCNALIRVMLSHTPSPFTPIATSLTTALFNYMDESSFVCAYRDLTMNRRAVIPTLPELDADMKNRLDAIMTRGSFNVSQFSAAVAFPPTGFTFIDISADWNAPQAHLWVNFQCLRSTYQCPGQSRFFGDAGSLVEFFAPHKVNHTLMAHLQRPPYGVAAVWRMNGAICDERCHLGDHRLRETQTFPSILEVPLHYGTFTTYVAHGDNTLLRRIRFPVSQTPQIHTPFLTDWLCRRMRGGGLSADVIGRG